MKTSFFLVSLAWCVATVAAGSSYWSQILGKKDDTDHDDDNSDKYDGGWSWNWWAGYSGRSKCAATTYEATFDSNEALANGVKGFFEIDICNDGSAAYYEADFDLGGLKGLSDDETELKYHLHSAYNSLAKEGNNKGGTGGHYDATYKCGGASSNKGSALCDTTEYTCSTSNKGRCETGDLSGKLGTLKITERTYRYGRLSHKTVRVVDTGKNPLKDVTNVPRNADYSPTGSTLNGAAFSSIVFHRASDNSRIFGARLVRKGGPTAACKATRYFGSLNANEPLANGVTGDFEMSLCDDGSVASYTGDIDLEGLTATTPYFEADQVAKISYFESDSTDPAGPFEPSTVKGTVAVKVTADGGLQVDATLKGLLPEAGAKGGLHIHYGSSCADEASVKGDAPADANKGHYYDPTGGLVDPWADIKWTSDASGKGTASATITKAQLGAAGSTALDRVVIVHNKDGGKIGCGVLSGKFGLAFHLHSAYTTKGGANSAFKGTIGGTGTSGHYDPTFKCGGASSNAGDSRCSSPYVCSPKDQSGCELGDLSGKVGSLAYKGLGGHLAFDIRNDGQPPRNTDFAQQRSGSADGAFFQSVVFHDAAGGRLFGFRLLKDCGATTRYSSRFGSQEPLSNGASGRFDARVCNDKTYALYDAVIDVQGTAETQVAEISYFASDSSGPPAGPYSPATVGGKVFVTANLDGSLTVRAELSGLGDAGNEGGGLHIHYGSSCANEASVKGLAPVDANKGHYYVPGREDPWANIKWGADGKGEGCFGVKVAYGAGCSKDSITITEAQLGAAGATALNRVVIVHNGEGQKIGCGLLTQGGLFNYHFHSGYTPDSVGPASTGGHYDPTFRCGKATSWGAPFCTAEAKAAYQCSGDDADQDKCELGDLSGKLGPMRISGEAKIEYFSSDKVYGGYSPKTAAGSVSVVVNPDESITLRASLKGLEASESGGIHIHYGRSCDNEASVLGDGDVADANKGHYYVPADDEWEWVSMTPVGWSESILMRSTTRVVSKATNDPWTTVVWTSNANGVGTASAVITKDALNAPGASVLGRVVIVHNSKGEKIGCGVLQNKITLDGVVDVNPPLQNDWTAGPGETDRGNSLTSLVFHRPSERIFGGKLNKQ